MPLQCALQSGSEFARAGKSEAAKLVKRLFGQELLCEAA
jgi:hypothetical protein